MHYFTISTRPRSTLLPSKNRSKGLEIGVICDDLRVGKWEEGWRRDGVNFVSCFGGKRVGLFRFFSS